MIPLSAGTVYAEAGLLKLLDSAGHVVGERAFTASQDSGLAEINVASNVPFSAVELVAGAYHDGVFDYGAYATADGHFGRSAYEDASHKLHGSDFLVHELDFVFPPLLGVSTATIATDHFG